LPDQQQIDVLPLGNDRAGQMAGWCTVAVELDGPEIEVLCGGVNSKQPTHAAIWRQGNLLHFGFQPSPDGLDDNGRKLLLNSVAYIARFVTDRPLVRGRSMFDPAGPGPSRYWLEQFLARPEIAVDDLAGWFAEPWQARIAALDGKAAREFVQARRPAMIADGRKFTFDEDALALGVDLRAPDAPGKLVAQLDGERGPRLRVLLQRMLPEWPQPEPIADNLLSWLQTHDKALAHDPLSLCLRIDPVALWRHVPSATLRGPDRADGDVVREPKALELARRIAAHHGGERAFDDLHTFAATSGAERFFWDRDHGVLRIENSAKLRPGTFGTAWEVVIFDPVQDVDLLMGGGPPPRPRVSGRGMYRELVARLFLPLWLLRPGTALERLPDDADGHQCLGVRLAGRALDPTASFVLHVDQDGAIAVFEAKTQSARMGTEVVTATTACGPLLLPTTFVRQVRRGEQTTTWTDLQWNPKPPEGLAAAPARLLGN